MFPGSFYIFGKVSGFGLQFLWSRFFLFIPILTIFDKINVTSGTPLPDNAFCRWFPIVKEAERKEYTFKLAFPQTNKSQSRVWVVRDRKDPRFTVNQIDSIIINSNI